MRRLGQRIYHLEPGTVTWWGRFDIYSLRVVDVRLNKTLEINQVGDCAPKSPRSQYPGNLTVRRMVLPADNFDHTYTRKQPVAL